MKMLETIFKRLQDAGLALNLKKCLFGEKEIDFVGYKVTSNGITPLERKMDAIVAFPPPQKQKQLLGFLGAVNYYRRSLPHVNGQSPASILQPLYTAATNLRDNFQENVG